MRYDERAYATCSIPIGMMDGKTHHTYRHRVFASAGRRLVVVAQAIPPPIRDASGRREVVVIVSRATPGLVVDLKGQDQPL